VCGFVPSAHFEEAAFCSILPKAPLGLFEQGSGDALALVFGVNGEVLHFRLINHAVESGKT